GGGHVEDGKKQSVFKRLSKLFKSCTRFVNDNCQSTKCSKEFLQKLLTIIEDSCLVNAGCGSNLTEKGFKELECVAADLDLYFSIIKCRILKNPSELALKLLKKRFTCDCEGRIVPVILTGDCIRRNCEELNIGLLDENNTNLSDNVELNLSSTSDTIGVILVQDDAKLILVNSSGGSNCKISGRIGSSPINGAGFYIGKLECPDYCEDDGDDGDDLNIAIVCSGKGEQILVLTLSYEVYDQIRFNFMTQPLPDILENVLNRCQRKLSKIGDSDELEIAFIVVISQLKGNGKVQIETCFVNTTQVFPAGIIAKRGDNRIYNLNLITPFQY
ncbi:MAG: hypothetical protein MHMPM18_003026, partial [Marteilia pararefringens]